MQRPLSPHLSVYKPQLTSVLSILHRFTGVALFVAAFFLVTCIACVAHGPAAYEVLFYFLNTWVGRLGIGGLFFAFYYHFFNGLRHLYWDIGQGYDLSVTYRTGWLVMSVTALATLITIWHFFL